jgi:hypothetical protein
MSAMVGADVPASASVQSTAFAKLFPGTKPRSQFTNCSRRDSGRTRSTIVSRRAANGTSEKSTR